MNKEKDWSTFAILGFIFAFVIAPLGLVFSVIGISNCNVEKYKGIGLAIAGTVIGALGTIYALFVLLILLGL